jgi:hypothetical protein
LLDILNDTVINGDAFSECESFYRAATLTGAELDRLSLAALGHGLTDEPEEFVALLTG